MSKNQNLVGNLSSAEKSTQNTMMDVWRESIERSRKQAQAPLQVAKGKEESSSSLEEKIRNREVPCPTCMNRKYKDESDDSGVSYQTATRLSPATAGVNVLRHENEHVARNRGDGTGAESGASEKEGAPIQISHVSITYDICPDCGRQFVSGGVTRTTRMANHASNCDFAEDTEGSAQKEPAAAGGGIDFHA